MDARTVSIALMASLLPAAGALAESPRDAIFPTDATCYLRHYDKGHLASHPDQLVTQIALGPMQEAFGDPRQTIVTLMLWRRGSSEGYVASAYCENEADHLYCPMEGDAGAFALTPQKGGKVMLKVARRGMAFEGGRDFFEISGTSGDDRAFLLPRVPADACP